MTTTIVAIPVIKDARKFHLEKGRRWSVVEHILLEALARDDWSIRDLTKASNLPRRMVIESVVRLMRAGWVELNQKSDRLLFSSTPMGRLLAGRDELPPVTKVESRYVGYVVDLFSGTVFRARELPTINEEQWRERREGRNWGEVPSFLNRENALPDIQVLADQLLEHDERLTRVDINDRRPRILKSVVMVRDDEIDCGDAKLPAQLRKAILETAKASRRSSTSSIIRVSPPPRTHCLRQPKAHPIAFRKDDLILGGSNHERAIRNAVEKARHRIIIHSTFMSQKRATATLDLLRKSIQRGVLIDILWGQSSTKRGVNSTRQAAIALQELLQTEGLQDRVRVHSSSTRSHAKLILSDLGEPNHFQAILGSCNWLSSDFGSYDVSVKLREPALVADLAYDMAEIARPRDGQIPDLSVELVRLGPSLITSIDNAKRGSAKIVDAPSHAGILADARELAMQRILLLSHRLDVAAKPALTAVAAAAQKGGASQLDAIYTRPGDQVSEAEAQALENWAGDKGIKLRRSKLKMHGKVLAWDDNHLLVSSLNLLSADPVDGDPRQELGVLIEHPNVARGFIDEFERAQI